MAEDIKSALHDATPSWNGYNYQGKVGLYVCLKNILNKANEAGINSLQFNEFLNNFTIEYEWIEDFSIKNNNQYISLHQVKHKAGTGFSDHISAITTILNRKLCRLSETDFIKYIDLEIDYTGHNLPDAKRQKKHNVISSKFNDMRLCGYINEENKLSANWREIEAEVDGIETIALKYMLGEFQSFSDRTFTNSEVYFHTAENVSNPNLNIDEYTGIPEYHKDSVRGLRTLTTLNIFLGFDNCQKYELVQSDNRLVQNINVLIRELLQLTLPDETFAEDDISLYQASICQVIDKHIASRHNKIRNGENRGFGFDEERSGLKFIKIYEPLLYTFQNQDEEYWDKFCMRCFENTFLGEISKIETHIARNSNKEKNEKRKKNLENYRRIITSNYKYSKLFEMLSPHIGHNISKIDFFNKISNESMLKNVFLGFIKDLDKDFDNFIIMGNDSLSYHPSSISFESDDEDDWDYNIEKYRHEITTNNLAFSLSNASHLVVKVSQGHNVSDQIVNIENIVDSIYSETSSDHENSVTNVSYIKFESISEALRMINNE